ncbi:MAG: glycosyltransferase [Bacteroidota bacterium]
MSVDCTIVIPHLNQHLSLEKCLDALQRQRTKFSYEIIIMDNGSVPAVDVTGINDCRLYVETQAANPYVLRNLGVRISDSDYVAFLDARCEPQESWLDSMMRAAQKTGVAGGKYEVRADSEDLRDHVYPLLYLDNRKNIEKNYGITAGNLIVEKSLFDKYGGFDETHRSGSDISWTRQRLEDGERITYASDAIVMYPAQSWPELLIKVKKYAQGAAYHADATKWRFRDFMPLGLETFRSALAHRQMEHISIWTKYRLWVYASMIKLRYHWIRYRYMNHEWM